MGKFSNIFVRVIILTFLWYPPTKQTGCWVLSWSHLSYNGTNCYFHQLLLYVTFMYTCLPLVLDCKNIASLNLLSVVHLYILHLIIGKLVCIVHVPLVLCVQLRKNEIGWFHSVKLCHDLNRTKIARQQTMIFASADIAECTKLGRAMLLLM
jgi:hypothetical protein